MKFALGDIPRSDAIINEIKHIKDVVQSPEKWIFPTCVALKTLVIEHQGHFLFSHSKKCYWIQLKQKRYHSFSFQTSWLEKISTKDQHDGTQYIKNWKGIFFNWTLNSKMYISLRTSTHNPHTNQFFIIFVSKLNHEHRKHFQH